MTDRTAPGHAAVRVVRASDPAAEAMRLAAELDADVAVDVGVAERAVRVRVEAGRAATGGAAADDLVVIARAEQIRAAAAQPPPIGDDEVEELRRLAADLGRATRIRQRTEIRVQEVLQAKVAASTGVAIHPEAVTSASEAVVAAERALAAAESDLVALDVPAADAEPIEPVDDDPVLRLPHDDFDEALLERRHGSRRAVLAVVVAAAVAGVAVALGAPVLVLPVAAVVAVLAALLLVVRGQRAARELDAPAPAASPVVEPAPTPQPAPPDRAALEAAVESARERLRVARNRWHQLAGPDADPHRPGAVVRAHDPQLAYDDRVAESSPTMRTVAAFHRKAQARWRVVWAAMGRDEPPAPDALEATLDELLAGHRAAVAELAALEAAEARGDARHAARRPLILVEPQTWVTPGRLDQLVASVPPEGEVILVEKG